MINIFAKKSNFLLDVSGFAPNFRDLCDFETKLLDVSDLENKLLIIYGSYFEPKQWDYLILKLRDGYTWFPNQT
jgi:hypothetical protein